MQAAGDLPIARSPMERVVVRQERAEPAPDYSGLTVDPMDLPIELPDLPPIDPPADSSADLPDVDPSSPRVPVELVDHPRIVDLDAYERAGWGAARTGCVLRAPVIRRLVAAVESMPDDFGLAIFDGFRTIALQEELYDHYYATGTLRPGFINEPSRDPLRPAPHQTGGAVDLTLTWRGLPLRLGTDFDDMTDDAHPCAFEHAPGPIRSLRRLLHHTLTAHDFEAHHLEWWHFEYGTRAWAHARHCAALFGPVRPGDIEDLGGPGVTLPV
jgi:D-alanyl-D-alanine dipeptidase